MAQVTGMTAGKIAELTNEAVVSGTIDTETGVLTLQTMGGEVINAGSSVDLAVSQANAFTTSEVEATSFRPGLSTERPAHREGLAFYEIDTDSVIVSDGSAWHTVWKRDAPQMARGLEAVATGYVSLSDGGSEPDVKTVSFPVGRFTKLPKVVMQPTVGAGETTISNWHVSAVTTDGFTCGLNRSTSTIVHFMWTATQSTED